MAVERCVCHDLTFAELKALSERERLDFDGLRALTGCGTGCGLCRPYVRLMLDTGRTVFDPLPPDEAERLDPGDAD